MSKMISLSDIRKRLIDQLMAIKDEDFLKALSNMIDRSHIQSETIPLTDEQKIMLAMSDEDISAGRTIDKESLHESEVRWLREKLSGLKQCKTT